MLKKLDDICQAIAVTEEDKDEELLLHITHFASLLVNNRPKPKEAAKFVNKVIIEFCCRDRLDMAMEVIIAIGTAIAETTQKELLIFPGINKSSVQWHMDLSEELSKTKVYSEMLGAFYDAIDNGMLIEASGKPSFIRKGAAHEQRNKKSF